MRTIQFLIWHKTQNKETNKGNRFLKSILLILVLSVFTYSLSCQTLPADASKEIMQNRELYEIFIEDNRISDAGVFLAKIAVVFWNNSIYDSAIYYFEKAVDIFEEIEEYDKLNSLYTNLGAIHQETSNFKKSIKYYNQSLEISKQGKDHEAIAIKMLDLSTAYSMNNQFFMALDLSNQALTLARSNQNHTFILMSINQISEVYKNAGNKWKTMEYYLRFNHYRDSVEGNVYDLNALLTTEKRKYELTEGVEIAEAQPIKQKTKIEQQDKIADQSKDIDDFLTEKKKEAFESFTKEIDETEKFDSLDTASEKVEEKHQKLDIKAFFTRENFVIILVLANFLVIALIILFIILYFNKRNRTLTNSMGSHKSKILKTNNLLSEKNEIIEAQNEEIQAQRVAIAEQSNQITYQQNVIADDLSYAQRIQNVFLPKTDSVKYLVDGLFILYKPKDIVGGDFYWFTNKDKKLIIVSSDCMGHGVPGAFMSILGMKILHEIINERNIINPSDILNTLRKHILESLQQDKKKEMFDKMDIAIIIFDKQKNKLEIVAANQRIYIFRKDEVIEHPGDEMYVGHFMSMDNFTSKTYDVNKGDTIYIFSDGYIDQLGGKEGEKIEYKEFKDLLTKCKNMPITAQKQFLVDYFNQWKGTFDQIDDVMILGVKL